MSAGHGGAFGTDRGRPRYLADIDLALTDTWITALEGLTGDALTRVVGDHLSKRQISALEKRRDALLGR